MSAESMIVHFTTVHPRDDSRIRDKELSALHAAFGVTVAMYVQDGQANETDRRAGFSIMNTGPRQSRIKRMTVGGWRMFQAVRRAKPLVAHFHDPELIPWALLLRFWGIKVVYDVHEDYPRQVIHNGRIPKWLRHALSPLIAITEGFSSMFFDGIVVVTDDIATRFPKHKTVLVRNFPIFDELQPPSKRPMNDRPFEMTYIGTITQNRNIFRMIEAVASLRNSEARLRLAGKFSLEEDLKTAESMSAWARVKFDGWQSREGITQMLADSRAGLVLLKPVPHEMVTLPIKLFEYMAAGIPVISSDFPLWRDIVDGAQCGICVDPMDTAAITGAMQWILDNPAEAEAMGARGRRAVKEVYSWESEQAHLVDFYSRRLGMTSVSDPSGN